jgi:4-hydroxybenzoate polyprenyltransferase
VKKSRKALSVTFSLLWLSLFLSSTAITISIITWLLGMTSGWIPPIAAIMTGLIFYATMKVDEKIDKFEAPQQLEC